MNSVKKANETIALHWREYNASGQSTKINY